MFRIRMPLRGHLQSLSQSWWLPGLQTSQIHLQPNPSARIKPQVQTAVMKKGLPALSVMPTSLLVRSLMATSILSSPRLLNTCLPLMAHMAKSKSMIINPDKNLVVNGLMRLLFYNHFCAGSSDLEVKKTVSTMKEMGFKGVILGYAKEAAVEPTAGPEDTSGSELATPWESAIDQWREGNLRSLPMIGSGDILAVKFTGAGPKVTEALLKGRRPPTKLWESILEICDAAEKQQTRVWIDAEQQAFQPAIEAWTIDLMRRYNRNGKAHVYTTFQAYLKSTRNRIAQHLELARREDWLLGIKLVRGAYITSEHRQLIHDTKAETDAAYNSIAQDLLSCCFPPTISHVPPFPRVQLFLASHNAYSVQNAYTLHRSRVLSGLPTIPLEFGQLQGMADEVSCRLLQLCQQEARVKDTRSKEAIRVAPLTFKCLAWGSTGECMQFLVRRAVENRGSMDRTSAWAGGLRRELWRRLKAGVGIMERI